MLAFGQEFTVEGLWNDPRCLCSSVQVLYQRLKIHPPEEACVPSLWRIWGKTFKTLYEISQCDKCQVGYDTLKKRVGQMKIPLHMAVVAGVEAWSPGGNCQWKKWLADNTIQNHGCIILTGGNMPPDLMCQIYEVMQTGKRKPGVLHNKCGNKACINPAHYTRGYPRRPAKQRGWVQKSRGEAFEYVPKS